MATQYGDFPGVRVTTAGGAISAIEIGSEEKLVLFGRGDPNGGSASVNEPTQIGARREADTQFGDGTELAEAMRDALANGANISYLYGVMPETTDNTESFTTVSTGTLSNTPIVEDTSAMTVTDTTESATATVEFKYESPPNAPSSSNTVFVNPHTGEWTADESSDYDFEYDYLDWSSAFSAASNVVEEDETGVYVALSEAESVASTMNTEITSIRDDYKLVSGLAGAQPNQTGSDDGAELDTANYTDSLDSDRLFVLGPTRLDGSVNTILGAAGGLFAGNPINDPIYNEVLSGTGDLEQQITKSEADELRAEDVIPVRQSGSIRVADNLSTSTETDWERDFWRRRIVDRAILIGKQVGDRTVGRINDSETRNAAERLIQTELEAMVNDRLIEPNTSDEQKYYVDVYESTTDPDQVNIDIGITPQGVVKRIDENITIDT